MDLSRRLFLSGAAAAAAAAAAYDPERALWVPGAKKFFVPAPRPERRTPDTVYVEIVGIEWNAGHYCIVTLRKGRDSIRFPVEEPRDPSQAVVPIARLNEFLRNTAVGLPHA